MGKTTEIVEETPVLEDEKSSVTKMEIEMEEEKQPTEISSVIYEKYAEDITKEVLESVLSEQQILTEVVPEEQIEVEERPDEITEEFEEEKPKEETTEEVIK